MRWCTRDGHRDHCRSDATKEDGGRWSESGGRDLAVGSGRAVGADRSGLPPHRDPPDCEAPGTGLMAHLERRNCWTLAEAVGEKGPLRFQHLPSRAKWDDARVRTEIRSYVSEGLDTGGLVLVVDEAGDLKKGSETVAVQRHRGGDRTDRVRVLADPFGRTRGERPAALRRGTGRARARAGRTCSRKTTPLPATRHHST
jgi:hypothetical protein